MAWAGPRALIALVAAALLITSCGQSRLNPLNWFGRAQSATPEERRLAAAQSDPRALVAQVVAVEVARRPGGAIVTARGLPPTQGWWDGELVPAAGGKPLAGTLVFDFRIAPPPRARRIGPPRSREVVVGLFLSEQKLRGVRAIQVRGAGNALVARR